MKMRSFFERSLGVASGFCWRLLELLSVFRRVLRCGQMNRHEATGVLRELLGECNGLFLLRYVSLSRVKTQNPKEGEAYEMHISCGINESLRRSMNAVLERHQLTMKEKDSGEGVVIFQPQTSTPQGQG
jgi:uncharacterized protein (DUF697 family)